MLLVAVRAEKIHLTDLQLYMVNFLLNESLNSKVYLKIYFLFISQKHCLIYNIIYSNNM